MLRFRLLAWGVLLLLGACNDPSAAPPSASAPAVARKLAPADVSRAQVQPVRETVPLTATLGALRTSEIAAEIEARVREVRVREGEAVRRGQVLVRFDADTLSEQVKEQAAQLANEQTRLALARVKLEKQRELYAQGFISRLAIDELESDYRVREGSLEAQRAQLARAQRALADAELRAPIDGVIYRRSINPGDVVARNQKVLAVADLSELEAVASVPARLIGRIAPGQRAYLAVEGGGTVWGVVARVNPVANEGTRSFNVYIRLANPDGRLRVGQFAKGAVVLRTLDDKVAVPLAALQESAGKAWLFQVEGGKLARREVRVLLRDEAAGLVAVDGVPPGATVLTVPFEMRAGERVALPGQ